MAITVETKTVIDTPNCHIVLIDDSPTVIKIHFPFDLIGNEKEQYIQVAMISDLKSIVNCCIDALNELGEYHKKAKRSRK